MKIIGSADSVLLVMSRLIMIYSFCSLVFEFSIWYSLDEFAAFLLNFVNVNFVLLCGVGGALRLKQ